MYLRPQKFPLYISRRKRQMSRDPFEKKFVAGEVNLITTDYYFAPILSIILFLASACTYIIHSVWDGGSEIAKIQRLARISLQTADL